MKTIFSSNKTVEQVEVTLAEAVRELGCELVGTTVRNQYQVRPVVKGAQPKAATELCLQAQKRRKAIAKY